MKWHHNTTQEERDFDKLLILEAIENNTMFPVKEHPEDLYELFDIYYCQKCGVNEALENKFGLKKYVEVGGNGPLIDSKDLLSLNPVCIHRISDPESDYALNGDKVEYEYEEEEVVPESWFKKLIRTVRGFFKYE